MHVFDGIGWISILENPFLSSLPLCCPIPWIQKYHCTIRECKFACHSAGSNSHIRSSGHFRSRFALDQKRLRCPRLFNLTINTHTGFVTSQDLLPRMLMFHQDTSGWHPHHAAPEAQNKLSCLSWIIKNETGKRFWQFIHGISLAQKWSEQSQINFRRKLSLTISLLCCLHSAPYVEIQVTVENCWVAWHSWCSCSFQHSLKFDASTIGKHRVAGRTCREWCWMWVLTHQVFSSLFCSSQVSTWFFLVMQREELRPRGHPELVKGCMNPENRSGAMPCRLGQNIHRTSTEHCTCGREEDVSWHKLQVAVGSHHLQLPPSLEFCREDLAPAPMSPTDCSRVHRTRVELPFHQKWAESRILASQPAHITKKGIRFFSSGSHRKIHVAVPHTPNDTFPKNCWCQAPLHFCQILVFSFSFVFRNRFSTESIFNLYTQNRRNVESNILKKVGSEKADNLNFMWSTNNLAKMILITCDFCSHR